MKIALYIEDGLEQIVLTPESETEKLLLRKLDAADRDLTIHHGSFYECRGGWLRHQASFHGTYDGERKSDDSTMLVLRPKPPVEPGGGQQ